MINIHDIRKRYGLQKDHLSKYPLFSTGFGNYNKKFLIEEVEDLICKLIDDKTITESCPLYDRILNGRNRKIKVKEIVIELLKKYDINNDVTDIINKAINKYCKTDEVDDFSIARKIVDQVNFNNNMYLMKVKRKELADELINKTSIIDGIKNTEFVTKITSTNAYTNFINGKIIFDDFTKVANQYINIIKEREQRRKKLHTELKKHKIVVNDMISKLYAYYNYINNNGGSLERATSSIKNLIDMQNREAEMKQIVSDKNFSNYHKCKFYTNYVEGNINLKTALEELDAEIEKHKKKDTVEKRRNQIKLYIKTMKLPSYIKSTIINHEACNKYINTDTLQFADLKKILLQYRQTLIDTSPLGKEFASFLYNLNISILDNIEEIDIEYALFCNSNETSLDLHDYSSDERRYIIILCGNLKLQYENDNRNGRNIDIITKPDGWKL
jgi:hypothetical protein